MMDFKKNKVHILDKILKKGYPQNLFLNKKNSRLNDLNDSKRLNVNFLMNE